MAKDMTIATVQQTGARTFRLDIYMMISLAMIAIGLGAAIYAQYVGHHQAFANTREIPWGLMIGVYAYLAIISTGLCLMAAISHAFHLRSLLPLANRMVWLSIIFLFGAFFVIGAEVENPWRMPLNLVIHPNLTSNIWWMGTLYGLAVTLLVVEFYLLVTRRFAMAVVLGMVGAVAEMLANTNLGSVFASLSARPFWYGSQLPIFFLASALLSGAAAVVVCTFYAHSIGKRPLAGGTLQGLWAAGKIMVLMIFLILLATVWKFVNAYCGTEDLRLAADMLVRGPLATNFWLFEIGIGLLLPFLLLLATRMRSPQALSLAGLMVLVGQLFSRYNLVVAGLAVPQYPGYDDLPQYLHYAPSVAEYLLVVGGFGVIGCAFLLGERCFAAVFHTEQTEEG
ncbi:MAG: NrfD/PsrC family molybdoenzyme membrane anchor subunit [Desulfopila sp.]